MNSPIEKRKRLRYPVTIQSVFSSDVLRGEEGMVLDLTSEGCRIFSSAVPPPESAIELQLRPRHGSSVFISDAVVRWAGESAFGVEFKVVAGHESNRLAQLLSGATA